MNVADEEQLCRSAPAYPKEPCPGCGYVTQEKPAWVNHGVTFTLNGRDYKVAGIGATNRFAPGRLHFEDSIYCEPVESNWRLPDAPCPVAHVATALREFFGRPRFRPSELVNAVASAQKGHKTAPAKAVVRCER